METCLYERLSFTVEWFQEEAGLVRQFLLNYFPYDKSVEMFDKKKNKTFLKRVTVADLNVKMLYIGAKLNLFGRQVTISAYEDKYTNDIMTSQRQKAFALIPSKCLPKLGEVMKILCDNGFSISNCAMYELTRQQCNDFVTMLNFGMSVDWSAGPLVALILTGNDPFHRLNVQVEGADRETDEQHPALINFGNGAMNNVLFFPDSPENTQKACEIFFPSSLDPKSLHLATSFQNSTLCLIKPHAMLDGKCGDIILHITENRFVIKAMKMFNLKRQHCEEFLEVYNGVSPDYLQMVTELSSGPFLALEIGRTDPNESAYKSFRCLCGPFNPDIAREIHPNTIRARFGVNTVKNAVHCTDLEQDCLLEVEYFFTIMSQ